MTKSTKTTSGSAIKPTKLTKKARLIALLDRNNGATIAEASEKFGWQHHTTRAALTGLRKAGYEIETRRSKDGISSTYHIVGEGAERAA